MPRKGEETKKGLKVAERIFSRGNGTKIAKIFRFSLATRLVIEWGKKVEKESRLTESCSL